MKFLNYAAISILVLAMMSCGNQTASTETATDETEAGPTAGKKYGVKSGIITYEALEMLGIKTTQTIYFDDYGTKEAIESVTEGEIMGIKSKSHSWSITKDNFVYTFDIEKMTNNTNELEKVVNKMDMSQNPFANTDWTNLSDELKKEMDYKEEGEETVAGFSGKKVSVKMDKNAEGRIYAVTYKNVPLKVDMGQIKMVASKFEENASVPASVFELPKDYKVIDAAAMLQDLPME